jgi:DNA-binding XRE family transcriptional regulator
MTKFLYFLLDREIILAYNKLCKKYCHERVVSMERINKNIAKYRKKAKLTQEQLAKAMKVERTTVSAWELGKANPPVSRLKLLAKKLNCTVLDLI